MKHKILVKLAVVLIMISVSFVYYFVKNYANDPIIMDHETGGNQVNSENPVPEVLIVDISGEVINPQILELKKSSRVYEAINKAGGLTSKADLSMINLAGQLKDEQKIFIPALEKDTLTPGPIHVVEAELSEDETAVYVSIFGEIERPSVMKISENSRIFNVVELAGGLTEKADTGTINLAEKVLDGMKIYIPDKEKVAEANQTSININTATIEQLKTLDGIGDATAKKIVDYRNANGFFQKTEDIMNVSGIGESKYNQIKSKIRIY